MNPFAIIVAVKQSSEQSSPGNLKAKESFFLKQQYYRA